MPDDLIRFSGESTQARVRIKPPLPKFNNGSLSARGAPDRPRRSAIGLRPRAKVIASQYNESSSSNLPQRNRRKSCLDPPNRLSPSLEPTEDETPQKLQPGVAVTGIGFNPRKSCFIARPAPMVFGDLQTPSPIRSVKDDDGGKEDVVLIDETKVIENTSRKKIGGSFAWLRPPKVKTPQQSSQPIQRVIMQPTPFPTGPCPVFEECVEFAHDLRPLLDKLNIMSMCHNRFLEVTVVTNWMATLSIPVPVKHKGFVLRAMNNQYLSIDFGEHGTTYEFMHSFPLLPDFTTGVERYWIDLDPMGLLLYLQGSDKWTLFGNNCHSWTDNFISHVCGLTTDELKYNFDLRFDVFF